METIEMGNIYLNPNIKKVARYIHKYLDRSSVYKHETCIEIRYYNIFIFVNYDTINVYEFDMENPYKYTSTSYPMSMYKSDINSMLSNYKN